MEEKKTGPETEDDYSRELKQMNTVEIDAHIKECAEKDKKELDDFIEKS